MGVWQRAATLTAASSTAAELGQTASSVMLTPSCSRKSINRRMVWRSFGIADFPMKNGTRMLRIGRILADSLDPCSSAQSALSAFYRTVGKQFYCFFNGRLGFDAAGGAGGGRTA